MMEVIVIGATGFGGRNLVHYLQTQEEYSVLAVSRNGGDVGNAKGWRFDRLDRYKPSPDAVVVNLAASRYNSGNLSNSDILTSNVDIVGRVYQYCVRSGIKELRLFSSISVYPADSALLSDCVQIDFRDPPHKGEAMYAWAKRISEIYANLFHDEYGINTVTFRPTSPYGPFDSLDVKKAHVVPALIMKALSGPLVVRGNPEATRDFIFVEDVCRVVEETLLWTGVCDTYNLGSGVKTTIRELATQIGLCAGTDISFVGGDSVNPVVNRSCDISKLEEDLMHAEELTPLRDGLMKTIEWYKASL